MKKQILLCAVFLLCPVLLLAQTGLPPFGSFTNGGFDTINNQNLNAVFSIPIFSSSGRGLPLNLVLNYNTVIWQNSGSVWTPVANWGWQKDFPAGGSVSYYTYTRTIRCSDLNFYPETFFRNYIYVDAMGTPHNFPVNYWESSCDSYNGGTYAPAHATDGSGYYLAQAENNPVVIGPNGQVETGGTFTASDANGNYVTKTTVSCSGCVETDWKDSVGNTALKIIYTPNTTSPTSIQYKFLDGTGNYQTITLKFQAYNIKTNFGCANVTEDTATGSNAPSLPYEMDIPSPVSGTLKYLFTYEGSPGNTGYYTGRLQQVTLPTGGFYKYTYSSTNDGIDCADGTTLSMTRTVSDGTGSATWNYVRNESNLTTTVTTPQLPDTSNASDTVYTYNSIGQEVSKKIYADSPGTTLLRTINTTWATNGTPATQTVILEDNRTQSQTATTFDSNGLLDSMMEYDWGSGAHGSAIRTTTYSYQTSTNYTSQNIINLITSKQIKDGSGTIQYRQDTTYDGVALTCPTGAAQHDDTGHSCTSNYRGNPTAVTTYTSPSVPSGGITKNFTYDWFGNLLTAQLNCCTSKTWTYSATTQYSQPDSVTSGTPPTQLTTSYLYNLYLGLATKSTDPNNLVTNYSYDFFRRPLTATQVNGAVNGQSVTYSYNDTTFVNTVTTTIDSSKSVQQVAAVDGLGRVLTSTTEDINSNVISKVSAKYDLIGRAYQTSNPYQTGSPSYWTITAFDALGRPTSVTLPDGSATTYAPYTAQTVTITDPAGKKRKSQTDAAGRLVAVTEPDSSNALNKVTLYTYNVLDALASATDDAGTQTRAYTYDNLGRLVSTVTPEGGQTCFGTRSGTTCNQDGYDSFNNLLTRTDSRGVVTSYTYDGLNRLKGVGYTVVTGVPSTASVSLTYGTIASQFNNGALITITDGVGSESYSYNALEHLTQLQKVFTGTPNTTYTTSYTYNIAGELTQITYPSGRIVQQSVDAIGRLCEIAPSTTGCGTAASPYATGYSYNVASQVTGFKYGNGIYASLGFSSNRLQLNCLDYSTTNRNGTCTHDATTKFGLTYGYASSPNNNGQIASITDSVDNGRTAAYTYDPLSRLSTALTTGSVTYPQWGLSWGYDRYGNRLNQTLTAGSGYQGSVTVNPATNHITTAGYAYDANGNMTNDGMNTLTYDAENHSVTSSGTLGSGTYTYDGNGLRVKKVSASTTTVYVFSGSKVIAEYDNGAVPAAPSREFIYGGGTLLAKIDSSGTKYFHQDHLSNRLVTSSTGAVVEQVGHFPFGDPWYNATNDKLYFTSYERDAESGSDYAMARYYVWRIGRFTSLDPLAGSTSDPQSLDRYTYVENNPISLIDPSGQEECEANGDCAQGGAGFGWGGGDSWGGGGWSGDLNMFDFGFSQGIGAAPCLEGCTSNRYGVGGGGTVTYDFSGFHQADPDQGIFNNYYDLLTITYTGFGDPIQNSTGLGGGEINRARAAAVAILQGANPCADFFNKAPGIASAKLADIAITPYSGPNYFQPFTDSNGNLNGYMENAYFRPGPAGGTIELNQNGAFSQASAYAGQNSPGVTFPRVPLSQGPFAGGTLGAQIVVLLHEFAHSLNLIAPDNGPTAGAAAQSGTNTGTILDNCLTAIKVALQSF